MWTGHQNKVVVDDTPIDKQKVIYVYIYIDKKLIDRQIGKWMERKMNRWIGSIWIDRWIDRQIDRQMNRQRGRYIEMWIDRYIDGQWTYHK